MMNDLQKMAVGELDKLSKDAQATFAELQLPDGARTGTPAHRLFSQLAQIRAWAIALADDAKADR